MQDYVDWLKGNDSTVYEMDGTCWRMYQKSLVPASVKPEPIALSDAQAQALLKTSGALLIRYFSRTVEYPTSFWYSSCHEYNLPNLAKKVRGSIRRGYKTCRVERVEADWLAEHGYACYASAFSRYRNAKPDSKEEFQRVCRGAIGGPFEFWAVFVGEQLAGYEKFAVGPDYAAALVLKLDPSYLQECSGPALMDTTLRTYVTEQGKTVYNGFRSVVHETNTHDYLLTVGFSRVYCDLKVVYRPTVKICVNMLYNFRPLLKRLPESSLRSKVLGLISQEEMRRSMEETEERPYCANTLEPIAPPIPGTRYGATEK